MSAVYPLSVHRRIERQWAKRIQAINQIRSQVVATTRTVNYVLNDDGSLIPVAVRTIDQPQIDRTSTACIPMTSATRVRFRGRDSAIDNFFMNETRVETNSTGCAPRRVRLPERIRFRSKDGIKVENRRHHAFERDTFAQG
jgi:hypothetical protein